MASNDNKKYYWLKLNKDFFKKNEVKIIESMSNGKDYVLFYLKLLCESTSHNGELRFSETIPYNEDMIATITNTNVDIVRQAIKIFRELGMMEVYDDGTLYMAEVSKMLGCETGKAKRMREYRNSQKLIGGSNEPKCSLEIDIEKDIDIDKEIDNNKTKKFTKPSIEEIEQYCRERHNNIDAKHFYDYYESKGWVVGKAKMKDWRAAVRTWEANDKKANQKETSNPFIKLLMEEQNGTM